MHALITVNEMVVYALTVYKAHNHVHKINVWARDATQGMLVLASSINWSSMLAFTAAAQDDECAGDLSEDSIFLHDRVICGHHSTFKEIWTPHTFQPVVEVMVRVHRMPRLLIMRIHLINNS